MFEIEYQLTLEDDLNSLYTSREYTANLPLLSWQIGYVMPLTIAILNLPNLWQFFNTDIFSDTTFQSPLIFNTGLNLVYTLLLFPQIIARLPTNLLSKYKITKSWRENPHQVKARKLIVDETDFILIKEE